MENQRDLSKFLKPFIRQEVGIYFKELANQACDNKPTSTEISKYKSPHSNEGFYHYKCNYDSDAKDAKETSNNKAKPDGEGASICEICEHQMTLVRYNPTENLDDQSDQESIESCDTLVPASEVQERPEAYELTAYMRDEPWTAFQFHLTIAENDLIIESRMTSNCPQPDDDSSTLIRSTPIKDEEEEFAGQDGLLIGAAQPRIWEMEEGVIQDCEITEISSEVETDISSEVKTEIMMEEEPKNRYDEVQVQAPGAEYSAKPSLICNDVADDIQDCEKTVISSEVKTKIMMEEKPKNRYAEGRVQGPRAENSAKPSLICNDVADVIQDCEKTEITSEVKTEIMMKEERKTRYVQVRVNVPGAEYSARCGRFEKEVSNDEPKPPFFKLYSQEAEYCQNESMIRWPKDYQVRPCDERRIMPRDGNQVAILPPDMKAPIISKGGIACFVPLQPRTIITSEPPK